MPGFSCHREPGRGYAARSFGVFHDGKPIEVELVFKPVAAQEVLDYEFHPSQTVERLASGEVISLPLRLS